MTGDPSALSALSVTGGILLMALVTAATRIGGPAAIRWVGDSLRVRAFLDSMSVSVLAALVAHYLADSGFREGLAIMLAILVMLMLRNAAAAMVAAMIAAALWTGLIG
tara:strand:- start:189 stop:512 length:324 start_codon:yes stop_codon:yes gene_type:complete